MENATKKMTHNLCETPRPTCVKGASAAEPAPAPCPRDWQQCRCKLAPLRPRASESEPLAPSSWAGARLGSVLLFFNQRHFDCTATPTLVENWPATQP